MTTSANETQEGRVAVVSGGAGAIGSAIVDALREAGHRIVVLDRDGDVKVDLADEQSSKRAAAEILERYGQCDVFVHCAATFELAELKDLTAKTWRHVQTVNVESALWLAQAFTPGMAQRGFGRIVFIASDTFWEPPAPEYLAYIASKGALIGVMRSWRARLTRRHLRNRRRAPAHLHTGSTSSPQEELTSLSASRLCQRRRWSRQAMAARRWRRVSAPLARKTPVDSKRLWPMRAFASVAAAGRCRRLLQMVRGLLPRPLSPIRSREPIDAIVGPEQPLRSYPLANAYREYSHCGDQPSFPRPAGAVTTSWSSHHRGSRAVYSLPNRRNHTLSTPDILCAALEIGPSIRYLPISKCYTPW
jgi:NAD(P)-dependent dehydrogenase (short-subunit alcohol dehydrogenase family)